ncbi:MAG: glycine cleavage T C-terminal barrel domain-containing protein [Bryobacteraceae bacterium]
MTDGYQALRTSAAWLDLAGRGRIMASGEDRARLLHAMTTNHIQQLIPGQGCYAFFLSAQGRILSDAYIYCLSDRILIDVEPEQRERLLQHLDKFIIADDVTLEDVSDSLTAIGVEGPTAREALAKLGAPIPEDACAISEWGERLVAKTSVTGAPGFRVFLPPGEKAGLIAQLGIPAAANEDVRVERLAHFQPRYGEDITETTLPQETQLSHAIHFSKGCYLGQEIVERIRSRGHVNRLLTGVEIEGVDIPEPGTALTAAGTTVGEVTSAAYSPELRKIVALGYMRAQAAKPGTKLMAGDRTAITIRAAGPAQTVEC